MRNFDPLLAAALAAALACASCATGSARFDRHFEGATWKDSFREIGAEPEQAIPTYTLLGLAPIAYLFDDEITGEASKDDGDTGDWLSIALGAGAAGAGAVEWAAGDGGRSFEVAAESITATSLVTSLLKQSVGRRRPGDSGSTSSFPSGHTSFAFAGATFLARRIDDAYGGGKLGWWLFAPAALVAYSRVDADRHFTSDVVVGALLGVAITNWIYDAHYGAGGIFGEERSAWSLRAIPIDAGLALGVGASF